MFNLIKATDQWMCRDTFKLPRLKSYYPSEASVRFKTFDGEEKTCGKCMRQVWYRLSGYKSKGTNPYSEWIFAMGKAVEEILIEQWKEMGIWVGNNIKFYSPETNISGELDVVIKDPIGKLCIIETKSFAGYNATKEICGNKTICGKPKDQHLLQCLIYVDLCTKLKILDYGKLIYYARDSGNRNEFDITLYNDGGLTRPVINGSVDYRFTMEDVYNRYKQLDDCIKNKTVPPRDFEKEYNPAKIEKLFNSGEIAKTNYQKWKKDPVNNSIGDWECGLYCDFSDQCSLDK